MQNISPFLKKVMIIVKVIECYYFSEFCHNAQH